MMIDFFQLHSHQLESLLLEPQRPTLLTEGPQKFWAAFPNLELLGIYPNEPDFCGPRSTHPLRHLRLFSYRGSITPDIVLSEIRSFKTVTHVHITVDDLLSTEESSNLVKELRDRCRARGVAVVELPRMKIPRISDRYEWWTIPIVKAVLDSVGVVWK
ncbi:hypothetical protein FRC18_010177 [Serendipita sp. 400]|nr:hypothetical protein FRC18_010177 [Serendipita sp. 400]